MQPPQPPQAKDQYSRGGENRKQGETSEYRGEMDPAISVENVVVVRQFLKLKSPTFKGGMDPVKANDWLLEMEKNFRLLRCGERKKVKIDSYLLAGEASRMDWARFKVIFKEKYVLRACRMRRGTKFE